MHALVFLGCLIKMNALIKSYDNQILYWCAYGRLRYMGALHKWGRVVIGQLKKIRIFLGMNNSQITFYEPRVI